MATAGYLCEVKAVSSGTAMTDEATTTSDNLTYQITDSAKRILDLDTTVVVEDGGVPTSESYEINYLEGKIVFSSAVARTITVTGAYLTPVTVATADSYNLSINTDELDNTPFNTRFRTYQAGLTSGTATLGRFHVADSFFVDEILSGNIMLVEFLVDSTSTSLFYGIMTSDDVTADVADLIKESVTYRVSKQAKFD